MKNPFSSQPVNPDDASERRHLPRAHAFGKPANHVGPFLNAALQNFSLIAPLLFVAAVVLCVMAANQSALFITAITRDIKSTEANKIAPLLDKKPLQAADYKSAANIMAKNNSAVLVAVNTSNNALLVSIKDPALLPEFMYALATLQSFRQGVAWDGRELCLAKCDGGMAATAEISGYTQGISFDGLSTR
ncbi:hypothetical protein [Actimicrobium sp. CCI2.3]|uniref:hypothetical protein n=1 Tax=Actimicrobium sp. CCI2.3 TaxID=3048616 RepID=UPI002AB45B98|nr:hypothetical protein [Actimicrobium sp. CCI2.3]MDY7572987.1 hypothetical protein [Actimicrobium sp. CCI2.3]MEB0023635.1 hypothetical protein [Actimicrobium sp. CCI2.3]